MKFDYVIVGGGSAGCTLASLLSENPDVSVCLLEYGHPKHSNSENSNSSIHNGQLYPSLFLT